MSVDLADAIRINLLSPAVLFFALGILATLARSDLRFPEPLYVGLTIYLLIAIGFKGGVSVGKAGKWTCASLNRSSRRGPARRGCGA